MDSLAADARPFAAHTPRAIAVLLLVATLAGGCVWNQRREMIDAREAHHACVENHPHDADRACAELEANARVLAERYEGDALRSWGSGDATRGPCDPTDRAPRIPR